MTDSPYRVDFEALCKDLEQRGIDVGINPVLAAVAAIDRLTAERDGQAALAQAAAEDYNRARDELEARSADKRATLELAVERYLVDRLTALLRDSPRMSEQDIRARAALAAHPPFGMKNRLDVIDEIAAYIRDGSRKDLASFQPRVSAEERSDDTKDDEFGSAEALRAEVTHRCLSRISHRGAVIRCFYYRSHTEDRAVVVPLHEAAGVAWQDDDDRILADEEPRRGDRPYVCPGCEARYRTAAHAAGCADDHERVGDITDLGGSE